MNHTHAHILRPLSLTAVLAFVLASACSSEEPSSSTVIVMPDPGSGGGATTTTTGTGGTVAGPTCTPETCTDTVADDCIVAACNGDQCEVGLAMEGDACAHPAGGDGLCDTLGQCVTCLGDEDCTGTDYCAGGECLPATCDDNTMNGDETDVDCGGSCSRCANGESCNLPKDCASWSCDAGTCAACSTTADCPNNRYCDNGGVCRITRVLGQTCNADDWCKSDHCVDGVCCNSECAGTCESCSLGFALGSCTLTPDGQDPDDECIGICGCNGMGACGFCKK